MIDIECLWDFRC